ncbi:MAG: tlde1 domain-containing protein [Terriglobales bacterium]
MIGFKISTGDISLADACVGQGYSGAPGHVNNPADVALKGLGPIPPGTYTVSDPYTDPEKGPLCFRLTPDPSNVMYDRGSLLIHADNASKPPQHSSEGCIVAPHQVRQAVADYLPTSRTLVVTP